MKIYHLQELLPLLDKSAVIDAVKAALIAHAKGEVQSPMPGSLVFPEANGDCHIKYGQMDGSRHFAIKVATGFYDNPKRNLPASNGLIMVFDAETGIPQSLFLDEGWLTAWRTAAATALAAEILSPQPNPKIGIMGTGLQAQLAVEWIPLLLPKARFAMLGRNADTTLRVAAKLGIEAATNSAELLATCDIIITATPSAHELFSANAARPGMHFVGIGADGPEKAELPTGLFAKAAHILVDCPKQCPHCCLIVACISWLCRAPIRARRQAGEQQPHIICKCEQPQYNPPSTFNHLARNANQRVQRALEFHG